jgi:hypothetical protein
MINFKHESGNPLPSKVPIQFFSFLSLNIAKVYPGTRCHSIRADSVELCAFARRPQPIAEIHHAYDEVYTG